MWKIAANLIVLSTATLLVVRGCDGYSENSDPIIQTEFGKVRGTVNRALGSPTLVYSYFGVQYGRSPDYLFRFMQPENPWKWDDVRNATDENRPMCMQDKDRYEGLRRATFLKHLMPENPRMSENCLMLDIFTPVSPGKAASLLPVIVWIHGGSFDAFCSSTKLWALPAFENVVLVQIQYRLGLFGFFTTHDKWAPPNIAFHDQIKAMQWVQTNIQAFGGDPNSVTLMGESAGAVAATAHLLTPNSKGLFHRVIALSGAPDTMKWADTYIDSARRLGKAANCDFESTDSMDMCLQNKATSSRLMRFAKESKADFKLSEDKTLFPDRVRVLIEKKLFASTVPVLMGVTSGEANYILSRKRFADLYEKGPKASREELKDGLKQILGALYPPKNIEKITSAVIQEYLDKNNGENSGLRNFESFLKAVADFWFVSKSAKLAGKLKEAGQRTYFFEFTLKPSMYDTKSDEYPRPYNFSSPDHADDLLYAFGFPFIADYVVEENAMSFTDTERDISKKFMHIIAQFAKTGVPPAEMNWPEYPRYLRFGRTLEVQSQPFRDKRMKFWNEIINKIAFDGE